MKGSLKLHCRRILIFILLMSMFSISDIRVYAAPMILSGNANTDRIYVAPGANAELTLDGLHIDLSGYTSYRGRAIDLTNSNASIILAEGRGNSLRSGGSAKYISREVR